MREQLSQYRLNLADRPFVNMSAPWLIMGILAGLVLILTAFNIFILLGISGGSEETTNRIEQMNLEMDEMRLEIQSIDRQLEQFDPALLNHQVTKVNDLITRRTLSWSALFDNLEQLVPDDLKMLRISPRVSASQLQLSFRVVVPRQEVIRQFITALEESPNFSDVRLSSEVTDASIGQMVWELSTLYDEAVEVE